MRRISTILFILSLIISCDSENKNPDILFIAVDDLNDWANCLGGREGVFTPNLDHLAGESMLFKNAHCTAPACCPSRTSVMTGVRPSTSGIYANKNEWRKSPVLANAKTIPEYFREQPRYAKEVNLPPISWKIRSRPTEKLTVSVFKPE